jgi:hypothetical protein
MGINQGRWTAEVDGDFVVFLIGARVNRPLRLPRALRMIAGMRPMLEYLSSRPDKGLLGYTMGFPTIVQYWRDFESLEAFARDRDDPHLAAWRRYWKLARDGADAGIWHETYKVRAGEYEAIYGNMPEYGLAKAGRLVPLASGSGARERIAASPGA